MALTLDKVKAKELRE